MLHTYPITTTVNTPKTTPDEKRVKLTPGVVERVMIQFPAGCAGLVGVRISLGLFQLWPLTANEWIASDDFIADFAEQRVLAPHETNLRIETYNLDTVHPHTVTVSLVVNHLAPSTIELAPVTVADLPADVEEFLGVLPKLLEDTSALHKSIVEIVGPSLLRIEQASAEQLRTEVKRLSLEELSRV